MKMARQYANEIGKLYRLNTLDSIILNYCHFTQDQTIFFSIKHTFKILKLSFLIVQIIFKNLEKMIKIFFIIFFGLFHSLFFENSFTNKFSLKRDHVMFVSIH